MNGQGWLGLIGALCFWVGFLTCGSMFAQGPFWDAYRDITDPVFWWRKVMGKRRN